MPGTKKTTDIFTVSFLLILLVTAFLARSPYSVPVPIRDSGIFLSIGSDILHGKILYQQTWDNKQPFLYVINAAGLWLGHGSGWGVWGLELALLILVFLLSYQVIRRVLTPGHSFVVIAISFLSVFPFMGGNYSEEYSLVFQAGILGLLFGVYLPDRKRISRPLAALAMGILVGFVFCIKQTYLDIPLTVVLFLVFLAWIEKDRRLIRNLLLMGAGFLVVNVPVFIYFQAHGALRDYIVNAFQFNRYYSYMTIPGRFNSLLDKIKFVSSHPFFFLTASLWLWILVLLLMSARHGIDRFLSHPYTKRAVLMASFVCLLLFIAAQFLGRYSQIGILQGMALVIGLFCGGISLFLHLRKPVLSGNGSFTLEWLRGECSKLDWRNPAPAALLFIGLIDLPVFIFTISLSGKPWTHYYIPIFPGLVLLLAGSLACINKRIEPDSKKIILNTLLAAILVTGSIPALNQVITNLSEPSGGDVRSITAAYLKSATTPQDTILVWGWESVIYFLAQREAPTRFALPFALYVDTPYLDEYAGILLKEVAAQPPAYIADLNDPGMPLIEGRPAVTCLSENHISNQRMIDFLAFVCANYEEDRSFETINIYRLRTKK